MLCSHRVTRIARKDRAETNDERLSATRVSPRVLERDCAAVVESPTAVRDGAILEVCDVRFVMDAVETCVRPTVFAMLPNSRTAAQRRKW
ncbi:MAG: hypothetical protein DWH97_08805 [Planctomycetota bacterium]|nr:MAG: hypothetical protein DWH97_08805 [Planctomycetota bacterium]RLS92526.1 MAG: hypothetical protein DWI12_11005 [Planctomycetota bacterium]